MIWLALDDVDVENGCVVFAKGSHALGTVPHTASGVLGFSQTVMEPPDLVRFPEVKAEMRRGSVSLHHCNMFHRSGPNRSARSRRALAVNFRTTRAVADLEKRARVKAEGARLLDGRQER
jgi:phytanoyl-CoA hydroxylase